MNAINDALRPLDAAVFSQPFTPEKILRALRRVAWTGSGQSAFSTWASRAPARINCRVWSMFLRRK